MSAVTRLTERKWALPGAVMVIAIALALLVGAIGLRQLLTLTNEVRHVQTRVVQEALSALYRDLQMVNVLIGGTGRRSGAETQQYMAVRRDQLETVRWLGLVAAGDERPQVLLASAEMRGYDPRRDPALAIPLRDAAEGSVAAAIPASHQEQASLAIVLGSQGNTRATLVALIDGQHLIERNVGPLDRKTMQMSLLLNGDTIGQWPRTPERPDTTPARTSAISMATLTFTLAFGPVSPLFLAEHLLPQIIVILAGGVALAVVHRRCRKQRPVLSAPAATTAERPPAPGADTWRRRLWQLGELAATLSHDLGQPLNVIRLTAESAQDCLTHGRLDDDRLKRVLSNTVAQTLRAQAMMDAILAASRRPALPPVHLPPVETVRQQLAQALPQIRAAQVRLRWHADLSAPMVLGHPVRLGHVVRHLIINALEALAARALDQPPGTLAVECRSEGSRVIITIADDGPGFPPALLPVLNDPQAPLPERTKGCGLGLTIALGVAEEMGGSLSVANTPAGTRVTLALPAARRAVLVVEDDADAVREVAEYLAAKGWTVRTASGGNSALVQFQNSGADAVITDLNMSEGDGWMLIERLRLQSPGLPVIAMSTCDGDEARRAVTAGAALVLRKPVGLAELADELNSLTTSEW